MKKIVLLSSLFFLFSCSSDEGITDRTISSDPMEIRLDGELNTLSVNTRGEGIITGTKPSKTLALDIFRADATSGTTYGTTYTSNLTGSMATSGVITMTPAQYYQSGPTNSTKLIGLYPSGGTYASAGRTVTFGALDGGTDIMCSGFVSGNRNTPVTAIIFSHLLTQVHVKVLAANSDAIAVWGNITGITIADKKIGAVVTLPAPNTTGGAIIAAATGTAAALSLTTAAGAAASTSQALTTSAATYGYGMFLPVTSAGKLTFNISTAKGGTQTLTTAADQTFDAGKSYEMTITFNVSGISITATLTDWVAGTGITGSL